VEKERSAQYRIHLGGKRGKEALRNFAHTVDQKEALASILAAKLEVNGGGCPSLTQTEHEKKEKRKNSFPR